MTLDEAIILWNQPHNRQTAVAGLGDPELLAAVKAEINRLADPAGPRVLIEHDHLSRERHRALTALLAAAPKEKK